MKMLAQATSCGIARVVRPSTRFALHILMFANLFGMPTAWSSPLDGGRENASPPVVYEKVDGSPFVWVPLTHTQMQNLKSSCGTVENGEDLLRSAAPLSLAISVGTTIANPALQLKPLQVITVAGLIGVSNTFLLSLNPAELVLLVKEMQEGQPAWAWAKFEILAKESEIDPVEALRLLNFFLVIGSNCDEGYQKNLSETLLKISQQARQHRDLNHLGHMLLLGEALIANSKGSPTYSSHQQRQIRNIISQ